MSRKLLGGFALIFILLGGILCVAAYSVHYEAEVDMHELLYENENSIYTTPTPLSFISNESVDGDMQVAEVKSLKNCIVISSCGIKAPLVEGTLSDDLRVGVGHFVNTPKIGQNGNCCYAGHYSTIYNCVFNGIEKIKLWDCIEMYNSNGKRYVYYVTEKYITEPTDMTVLNGVTTECRLTLVTCAENGTKRLIVSGLCVPKGEKERLQKEMRLQNMENVVLLAKHSGTISISKYLEMKKGRY